MELEVTLPTKAGEIAPIFITSPCNHSGGALLQRAICATQSGICFGDNMFDEILSLVDWAVELIDRHQKLRDTEAGVLDRVLSKNPATWMPELAPPFDLYTSSLFSVIYNLPYTAQQYANENGLSTWAMSRAGIRASRINDLLSIFPSSKAIFIYRNPLDIARDRMRDHPDTDIRELCHEWSTVMQEYLHTSSPKLTKLRYEDAVDDTGQFVSELGAVTGLTGFDDATLTGGVEAETESSFELDEQQKDEIRMLSADMLAVHYPDLVL